MYGQQQRNAPGDDRRVVRLGYVRHHRHDFDDARFGVQSRFVWFYVDLVDLGDHRHDEYYVRVVGNVVGQLGYAVVVSEYL